MPRFRLRLLPVAVALMGCGADSGLIRGIVLLEDGVPEPGATVSLTGAARRDAVTDDDGEFMFQRLPDGRYALAISVPSTVEARRVQGIDVPSPGGTALAIRFTGAGSIIGRILLGDDVANDAVVEGVDIKIHEPPARATADAEGRFRFERVRRGRVSLSAVGRGIVSRESIPVLVERGKTTGVELTMINGRPPDTPGNRPPSITGPIVVTPLDTPQTDLTMLLPPATELVRGEAVLLECTATDPDGDPLQYVWSASSGSLISGSDRVATLTAGVESIGVSCSVLDGRGGMDSRDVVIDVLDPYYAGATLIPGGAILSNSYAGDFDLVVWLDDGRRGRVELPGSQWQPTGDGSIVVYNDRALGARSLLIGNIDTQAMVPTVTPLEVATLDAASYIATSSRIVWIDTSAQAWSRSMVGPETALMNAAGPRLVAAATGTMIAVESGPDEVHLIGSSGSPEFVVATPERNGNAFATDGTRVAFWANGRPMLATGVDVVELGSEQIRGSGRIFLTNEWVAYSHYRSPIEFVEATVVRLDGNTPLWSERVAIGPSEVLDLDGNRLLCGRPRSIETEPSADLWIVDLATVGVQP